MEDEKLPPKYYFLHYFYKYINGWPQNAFPLRKILTDFFV